MKAGFVNREYRRLLGDWSAQVLTQLNKDGGVFWLEDWEKQVSREDGRRRRRSTWGEFFLAQLPEGATGKAFVDFFRLNKQTGEPKGIVAMRLRGSKRQ